MQVLWASQLTRSGHRSLFSFLFFFFLLPLWEEGFNASVLIVALSLKNGMPCVPGQSGGFHWVVVLVVSESIGCLGRRPKGQFPGSKHQPAPHAFIC